VDEGKISYFLHISMIFLALSYLSALSLETQLSDVAYLALCPRCPSFTDRHSLYPTFRYCF
jgi:hypothetical protein